MRNLRACGRVFSFRRIVAIVFLALWLPVTQHCCLEAAGLLAETQNPAPTTCCETGNWCSHDVCSAVESGVIKDGRTAFKVLPPDFSPCLCLLCLRLSLPDLLDESVLLVSAPEHPLDWVPTWQFVRRAAPLARAPSLLG